MTLSKRFIELELETVTPTFAGGASPRRIDPHTPIRPSAVRGVLRQWFRAAAVAVLAPQPGADSERDLIRELAKLEAQVFGDTERASAVAVLAPVLDTKDALRHYPPGDPDRDRWPGLRYLGYGLFEDRLKGAQAIAERKRFKLRLSLRRIHGSTHAEQERLRNLLSATLWLWLALGALGARSRRGYGNLRLYPGEREGFAHEGFLCPDDLRVPPADHQALADYLARGKQWAWETFHEHLSTTRGKRLPGELDKHAARLPMRTLAGIDTFTPLPHEFADPSEALDFVGQLFRNYRSSLERGNRRQAPLPDYTSVKAALQLKRPPGSVERAAFGLPLPFYFRSLGGQSTRFVPKDPGRSGRLHDRMASPLCIRICPVGDAHSPRYVPVLYNWAGAHGAEPLLGREVWDVRNGGTVATPPDSSIIESFIDWARRQPRSRSRPQTGRQRGPQTGRGPDRGSR